MKIFMKRKKIIRCVFAFFCVCVLTASQTVPVFANSAQRSWYGTSATGTVIKGESCPIVVEKELLTFAVSEFPKEFYETTADYLAYTGKVTAEYTFYNPADYTVTATLVFPFGNIPDYGHTYNPDTEQTEFNTDTPKYEITVNGTAIEKKLRHTFSEYVSSFDLETDLPRLQDGYQKDAFYSLDLPITKYTYTVSGIDEEYTAATAAFSLTENGNRTKIMLEGQNGYHDLGTKALVETWAENGETHTIYVFGEPLSQPPQWTFYENGACEKEIDGQIVLTDTETMTFSDFVMTAYDENSAISQSDWYNAMVDRLHDLEYSYGLIENAFQFNFNITNSLMRWYEYEITLAPGERVVNTVTAPLYPSIDLSYDPGIYNYTYLLSPAQIWAEFGSLDVMVNTPYFMTESGMEGFEKTESGYTLSLDGLPDEELTFTLSSSENPVRKKYYSPNTIVIIIIIIIIPLTLLIAGGFLFFLLRRKKKK